MRQQLPGALVILLLFLAPAPADAWGADAHKFIMDQAIALMPADLRPLFERHRAAVVERAIDPDTWRTAGFELEDPNHFLDIDVGAYGAYPFSGLPRDWEAAVLKFGTERLRANGLVPWRSAEMYGNLRRAFEAYASSPSSSAQSTIVFFAAWMAHYTSDAHQPLHGIANYNGQLTGQTGVHGRFETTMFERFRSRLRLSPTAIAPVNNPRDFIFDAILEDTRLSPAILAADVAAIGNRDVYDDAYYEAFFTGAGGVMTRRLNDSIAAVAAMITGAWEAAGKPRLPLDPRPRPNGVADRDVAYRLPLIRAEDVMLWTLIVLLLLFWVLGFAFDVAGGLIHVLLVIAAVMFLVNLISGRRTAV